jgi:hypothetical protein
MHIVLLQTTASADAGTSSLISTVISLAIAVVMIVAIWKVFAKAGRPGWAALIPIYNTITLLNITGKSGWWFLGMLVPFLNIYVYIRLVFNLASVFGRGIGFGFGLLFLFPIFLMILAFGNAQYVGPGGNRGVASPAGYAPAPMA